MHPCPYHPIFPTCLVWPSQLDISTRPVPHALIATGTAPLAYLAAAKPASAPRPFHPLSTRPPPMQRGGDHDGIRALLCNKLWGGECTTSAHLIGWGPQQSRLGSPRRPHPRAIPANIRSVIHTTSLAPNLEAGGLQGPQAGLTCAGSGGGKAPVCRFTPCALHASENISEGRSPTRVAQCQAGAVFEARTASTCQSWYAGPGDRHGDGR